MTFGQEYAGGPVGEGKSAAPGYADSIWHWTPSIAPSGMAFYQGDIFPEFSGDLLVSSLLHHEDFMHLQETDFLNRDEHVKVISELATKPGWNWHKIAKCIYEDKYVSIIRWEDNGEIVTHVSTIKNDQVWRAVISRVPKASSDQ